MSAEKVEVYLRAAREAETMEEERYFLWLADTAAADSDGVPRGAELALVAVVVVALCLVAVVVWWLL